MISGSERSQWCPVEQASGRVERPVIVAMIAMRMVQAPCNQEVGVIGVGHRLMPAPSCVRMTRVAVDGLCVTIRMPGIHPDDVLIDVIAVRMVKMAGVEIVDVIVVTNRDMTTSLSVDVRVIAFMNCMRHEEERTCLGRSHQAPRHGTHSQTALKPVCCIGERDV